MNKIRVKIFTIFWLISGIIWGIVSVKRILNEESMVVVYVATTIVAFVLAFNSYKRQ